MLEFLGQRVRHCDGRSRRSFLRAGALGFGGLTLADLLRAENAASVGSSNKAIINIHLDGGPPQMDMVDPKPDAPSEIRGEFASIPTSLPGVHFSELMPKLASIAHKIVTLRSLVGAAGRHDGYQCQSGFDIGELAQTGDRPAMGSVLSKLLRSSDDETPTFVDIMQGRPQVRNSARPGFLGPAHTPFRPDISKMFHRELEPGMQGELARRGQEHNTRLTLADGLTVGRLDDRIELLQSLDATRRSIDESGSMVAMDDFTRQAYGILTSGRLAAAMDLENEDPRVLSRYTPDVREPDANFFTSEGPMAARKLLLARRLVEAGVRCVSVSISDFDTHQQNFSRMRTLGPIVDHAIHALITDLEERGMLEDVTVVAWGEFGRSPKINDKAGRDHWPKVAMGLLAGGGMRVGQVIGATDRHAAEAVERPVHYQDVIATLYHNIGIDARAVTIDDNAGRPQYLVTNGRPISELI